MDSPAYATTINTLQAKLAAYNTALSSIDKLADEVNTAERVVMEMSEKLLLGVGSRYGKTSQEYEMAGGKRRQTTRRRSASSSSNSSRLVSQKAATNGSSAAAVG